MTSPNGAEASLMHVTALRLLIIIRAFPNDHLIISRWLRG